MGPSPHQVDIDMPNDAAKEAPPTMDTNDSEDAEQSLFVWDEEMDMSPAPGAAERYADSVWKSLGKDCHFYNAAQVTADGRNQSGSLIEKAVSEPRPKRGLNLNTLDSLLKPQKNNKLVGFGPRLGALEPGFESRFESKLQSIFDALESRFESRLDTLESRFESRFESRLDALELRFESRLDALESGFESRLVEKLDERLNAVLLKAVENSNSRTANVGAETNSPLCQTADEIGPETVDILSDLGARVSALVYGAVPKLVKIKLKKLSR